MIVRRRAGSPGIRRLVRRVHLWLGLSVGLVFAVIGVSGSALVFYTAIDAALHPAVQGGQSGRAPGWDSPVWDRALATAHARWPNADGKWTFEVRGEGGTIPARYASGPGHHGDRMMLWFSADGRRVVRAEPWGGYLMSWLYQLHMALLAGDPGLRIVGWSGVAMLLLLVSGVVAWWPRGSWRKALAFRRDAAPIRRLRDLHKLSGVASAGLLSILVATGVLLALPDVTRALLAPSPLPVLLPAPLPVPLPAPRSVWGGTPIAITTALAAAHRALPDGRLVFVDVPGARDAAFRMRFQVPGDPHARFPSSYVFVDRSSARVLAVHDVWHAGTGTSVARWIRTLHDGTVGGMATRVLAVVLGLVPALLLATGIVHWLRRRRGMRAAAVRAGGLRRRIAFRSPAR